MLINLNRDELKQKKKEHCADDIEVEIPTGPRFFTESDENMFFAALNSIPSIIDVKGVGRGLVLYFKSPINTVEKDFLKGLLNRYQIPIPNDIEK